jgi:CBS domain-containing protein
MSLCTIGTRSVVTIEADAPAAAVACKMNDRSVGSVVVLDGDKPIGMITDRDLVTRVLCKGQDPLKTTARDVMSAPITTISEGADALRAASRMREAHVRRLPILDEGGELVGIVCLDDLAYHLARCHQEMAEAIAAFPIPHEGG